MSDRYISNYYTLEGRVAVKVAPQALAGRPSQAERTVAKTTVGNVLVSTVFLIVDHQLGDGPPLLFETMVFGGELDQEQERCSTWEEAEVMHKIMCERVEAATEIGRFRQALRARRVSENEEGRDK